MHPLLDQRRYLIPFRSGLLPQIFTDVLVIGAGVGGLRAGIAAAQAGADVIVLTKTAPDDSNTAWAQGGIAAVLSPDDSFEAHINDTLIAGADLCDRTAVEAVVRGGPERIAELVDWGMRFDTAGGAIGHGEGALALGQEGAHSHARIVHADGDATGRELVRCLLAKVASLPTIRLFTSCFALDLITPGGAGGVGGGEAGNGVYGQSNLAASSNTPAVMGAITHHPRYGLQMIWAKATILAAGGAGMIYRETTNPRSATADGLAMAYRAGAHVQDLAFVQFHPTTLYLAGRPRSLITEAIRGEGAHLVDHSGYRFMLDEHPMGELAPRDVVSRAIVRRLAGQGGTHVFLDCRHLGDFEQRFPGIADLLRGVELDPASDLIPVNPAAHYTIGGVVTDACGRTSVPGLLAVGEVASTGLHGANRLASNSLLEGLVVGHAAGVAAEERRRVPSPPGPVPIVSDIRPSGSGELDLADVLSSLRSAMWRNAGIERSGPRLHDVRDMIDFWSRYTLDKIFDGVEGWQTQNMLLVAALMARSAAWRTESRGTHWRDDHPSPNPGLRVHDRWRRGTAEPILVPVEGPSLEVASAGGASAAGASAGGARP